MEKSWGEKLAALTEVARDQAYRKEKMLNKLELLLEEEASRGGVELVLYQAQHLRLCGAILQYKVDLESLGLVVSGERGSWVTLSWAHHVVRTEAE